ncbi:unnamed protein product [Ceutorhynchus assimilis]|uniref:Uncharacterized protein n=1 Tax=Ceutorhynchus assimilis TaxID=467358 RepID=A0A9N9MXW8_9CUCU|nr:unnamed protein product [Ceutorhynchus assimilis]
MALTMRLKKATVKLLKRKEDKDKGLFQNDPISVDVLNMICRNHCRNKEVRHSNDVNRTDVPEITTTGIKTLRKVEIGDWNKSLGILLEIRSSFGQASAEVQVSNTQEGKFITAKLRFTFAPTPTLVPMVPTLSIFCHYENPQEVLPLEEEGKRKSFDVTWTVKFKIHPIQALASMLVYEKDDWKDPHNSWKYKNIFECHIGISLCMFLHC